MIALISPRDKAIPRDRCRIVPPRGGISATSERSVMIVFRISPTRYIGVIVFDKTSPSADTDTVRRQFRAQQFCWQKNISCPPRPFRQAIHRFHLGGLRQTLQHFPWRQVGFYSDILQSLQLSQNLPYTQSKTVMRHQGISSLCPRPIRMDLRSLIQWQMNTQGISEAERTGPWMRNHA
jgi:hypothetical protein